jgi:hypothetical protein
MEVFAQTKEGVASHDAPKPEHLSPLSRPHAVDALTLAIIVADGEMLLKIAPGILEIVLGFRRDHGSDVLLKLIPR